MCNKWRNHGIGEDMNKEFYFHNFPLLKQYLSAYLGISPCAKSFVSYPHLLPP